MQESRTRLHMWQVHLQPMPQLSGKTFGELAGYFPDAVVFGILQQAPQQCCINPPRSMVLQPEDEVIFVRPTSLTGDRFQPLHQPVHLDTGVPSRAEALGQDTPKKALVLCK